jgi:hypothetical protein
VRPSRRRDVGRLDANKTAMGRHKVEVQRNSIFIIEVCVYGSQL